MRDKFGILILGLIKNTQKKKINKICIIIYLLIQNNITKSSKLNTTMIYTKRFHNDGIKQFQKGFTMMLPTQFMHKLFFSLGKFNICLHHHHLHNNNSSSNNNNNNNNKKNRNDNNNNDNNNNNNDNNNSYNNNNNNNNNNLFSRV